MAAVTCRGPVETLGQTSNMDRERPRRMEDGTGPETVGKTALRIEAESSNPIIIAKPPTRVGRRSVREY